MMMKLAVLVALLACLAVNAQNPPPRPPPGGDFLTAFPDRFSWEFIFANTTSFLEQIDAHRNALYVSGEGYVHEIVEEPFEFSSRRYFFAQHHHRFIDYKVFEHDNVSYLFGPVEPRSMPSAGLAHPFQISSIHDEDITALDPSLHGTIQIAAVDVTSMHDHVVAYGAGWYIHHIDGVLAANFSVFKMFVHPNHTQFHNGSFISVNETIGMVILPNNAGYTEYTREFKPRIFHHSTTEQLMVIDPATDRIYRLKAPTNRSAPITFLSSYQTSFSSTNITSVAFDWEHATLVIGTRGGGVNFGRIQALDMRNFPDPLPLLNIPLGQWQSNPKALAIRGNQLFVGLNDASIILHMDLANQGAIIGYSTLPYYAREVHDLYASHRHLYIVTNEQYSKVGRTEYHHFCSHPCDSLYGYCNNGTCACHSSHVVNDTHYPGHCSPKFTTEENITTENKSTGVAGQVVLGLLFAICFLAAAAGWFVVYRQSQGLSVPFGLGKSRYSSVSQDREGLLGDD